MINKNIKKNIQKKIVNKNDIFHKTIILLKNRHELLKNKNKIISTQKNIAINIKKKHFDEKKIYLASQKFFYQSKMLKDKTILMILKKINPWYKEICKLKKLPEIAQKLAIHTSYKNTLKYWYVFLNYKNKNLMKYNAWNIFKKALSTITEKKIEIIIKQKNILDILTPYESFYKIYKERILKEHLLFTKDPNVQFLKKKFNAEFHKKNINLI